MTMKSQDSLIRPLLLLVYKGKHGWQLPMFMEHLPQASNQALAFVHLLNPYCSYLPKPNPVGIINSIV
jgi:hypothetical protein